MGKDTGKDTGKLIWRKESESLRFLQGYLFSKRGLVAVAFIFARSLFVFYTLDGLTL